jgi:hypothetical protein
VSKLGMIEDWTAATQTMGSTNCLSDFLLSRTEIDRKLGGSETSNDRWLVMNQFIEIISTTSITYRVKIVNILSISVGELRHSCVKISATLD